MDSHGQDEILGTAYSDHDLVVFFEGTCGAGPEALLDDPRWVEWRGGPAHEFSAVCVRAAAATRTGWSCPAAEADLRALGSARHIRVFGG